MSTRPTFKQIDAVGSFVEACEELEREPFFGPDEKLSIKDDGRITTYTLGDRFHFRSALISFRRIWMPDEPSHLHNIARIIVSFDDLKPISGFLDYHVQQIKTAEDSPRSFGSLTLKSRRVVDLCLNTVFAHGGLVGKNKRAEFEAAVAAGGHAPFEYAFRFLVRSIGMAYRNISKLVARPVLAAWKSAGLTTSFRVGSAFGIKRREVTSEGHILIRRGSSEFYSDETFEKRFSRFLDRHIYDGLKFVLERSESEFGTLLLAVLRANTIEAVLEYCGVKVNLMDRMPLDSPPTGRSLRGWIQVRPCIPSFLHDPGTWTRAAIYEGPVMETDRLGIQYLNDALKHFKSGLTEEQ